MSLSGPTEDIALRVCDGDYGRGCDGRLPSHDRQVVGHSRPRAAPNYQPLTQQANQQVFVLGPNVIPERPYLKATSKQEKPIN